LIHRLPDEAGVQTGEGAGAEGETSVSPDEHGLGEELDVDELASRVYAQIKRRFNVEWERVRQRG
jgi:hypothetical protein